MKKTKSKKTAVNKPSERALNRAVDVLLGVIGHVYNVIGPSACPVCAGCNYEMDAAIKTITRTLRMKPGKGRKNIYPFDHEAVKKWLLKTTSAVAYFG